MKNLYLENDITSHPLMGMWQNVYKTRNSNTKEINKRKKANSRQNFALFSAASDSENIIIQILHGKRETEIWTVLSSLGQEPTFKASSAVL